MRSLNAQKFIHANSSPDSLRFGTEDRTNFASFYVKHPLRDCVGNLVSQRGLMMPDMGHWSRHACLGMIFFFFGMLHKDVTSTKKM